MRTAPAADDPVEVLASTSLPRPQRRSCSPQPMSRNQRRRNLHGRWRRCSRRKPKLLPSAVEDAAGVLPIYDDAAWGFWRWYRRLSELLPEARGDATGGAWLCYRRQPELLPGYGGVATGGGWRCYRRWLTLLPTADGVAACVSGGGWHCFNLKSRSKSLLSHSVGAAQHGAGHSGPAAARSASSSSPRTTRTAWTRRCSGPAGWTCTSTWATAASSPSGSSRPTTTASTTTHSSPRSRSCFAMWRWRRRRSPRGCSRRTTPMPLSRWPRSC